MIPPSSAMYLNDAMAYLVLVLDINLCGVSINYVVREDSLVDSLEQV